MSFAALAGFSGGLLVAALLLTGAVLRYLRHKAILDMPNHRSSHAVPTPRGGGLAVTPLVLLMVGGVTIWFGDAGWPRGLMLAAGVGLAAICWMDDRHDLSARLRFGFQFIAVICGVTALGGPVLQGLVPVWLDHVFVVLAWVWFVNLFNFMDGIDGISGVEAGSIGAGVFVLSLLAFTPAFIDLGVIGLGIVAIMLGFLIWNWHPAKLFLGDVGSIPLGYVLGWLLLEMAARGAWMPALIFPAYYLFDATSTLLRRALRGEKIWQAHRQHAYQVATARGMSHGVVSFLILLANLILIAIVCTPLPGAIDGVIARLGLALIAVLLLVGVLRFWPVGRADQYMDE
jgi:UDP-N-acetylmuramyl pentapeptide phosphotransferase/UDP-N-acetylglucosamine-1-phosphate transferase